MTPSSLIVGWYGVVQVGDAWMAVTSADRAKTLFLPAAIEAGATHIAYWNGWVWEFVEPVEG